VNPVDPANALLLLDKPAGCTSRELVNDVQKRLGIRRAGHGGTLDRFASGLMLVFTGRFTRLSRYFLESDKEYLARLRLGRETDTCDPEGEVVYKWDRALPKKEDIIQALHSFRGTIEQVPPLYSAVKVKGKRASDRVRKGETLQLEPREITIYDLELVEYEPSTGESLLRVRCSKGTYIRSLARDLGRQLECGAFLRDLRRIASGHFHVDSACTLENLPVEKGEAECLVAPARALDHLGTVVVTGEGRERVRNGSPFSREEVIEHLPVKGQPCRVLDEEKNLIAIAEVDGEKWQIAYHGVFNG
jgi:tRNA pseudouridine55 synthase